MEPTPSVDDFDYNDRYGIKSQRGGVIVVIVVGLLFGTWLTWSALHHANPVISSSLVSFDNTDPRNIEISYTLTRRDPSQPATCVLMARDFDKTIVGQIEDHVEATEETSIVRTMTIPSRGDAVNAQVVNCRID